MKRLLCFWVLAVLIMPTLGCSSNSTNSSTDLNPIKLRLAGEIASVKSSRVNANDFEAGDKVGVYVSTTGAILQQKNALDNEPFTYSDGELIASIGKEVYWGSPDVSLSVWAYYPYVENIEDNSAHAFAVKQDQSTEDAFYDSDFISAEECNIAPQSSPVLLTFVHRLSKISVTLVAGDGITSEELAIATKKLTFDGMFVDGTINLSSGKAIKGSTKAPLIPFTTDGLNYSAIVYPQNGTVEFRLDMNGEVYTCSTDVAYLQGGQYKYTLCVNKQEPQKLTLMSAIIIPWSNNGEVVDLEMNGIISFSDPAFKEYLLQEVLYTDISYNPDEDKNKIAQRNNIDATSNGEKIDANNDGEISIAEAERVIYLNIRGVGISDLNELYYFANLQYLECDKSIFDNNQPNLTNLDVSRNKKLKFLQCASNNLTSLDVSENKDLVFLDCGGTGLTELDLSNNIALRTLFCGSNGLEALDLSNNTALTFLHCYNNKLSSLDLSNNTMLDGLFCSANPLGTLDLSKNDKLTFLWCYDNQLTTLDLLNNPLLTELNCSGNMLTTLDLSQHKALSSIHCSNNNLLSLDVSNNGELSSLYCNPMNDEEGNNILSTIYMSEGQVIENFNKPDEAVIEYK